jgi:hypothetical protein
MPDRSPFPMIRKEDSLYFEYFYKDVYNDSRIIRDCGKKLRKLKKLQ